MSNKGSTRQKIKRAYEQAIEKVDDAGACILSIKEIIGEPHAQLDAGNEAILSILATARSIIDGIEKHV